MIRKGTRTVVNTKTGKTRDFSVDMSEPKESRQKENKKVSEEMTEALRLVTSNNRKILPEQP